MKKTIIILSIISCLLLTTSWVSGHGIKLSLKEVKPCVTANARYHGSKVLANATVMITFAEDKLEFQKGNTDQDGNFRFCPDRPGKWIVTVDDLAGHRGKKSIILSQDFFTPPPSLAKEEATHSSDSQIDSAKEISSSPKEEHPQISQLPVDKQEESQSPSDSGELCCYLLKILVGVILILVIAFIIYRFLKRKENTK